jgi:hypothetical protein
MDQLANTIELRILLRQSQLTDAATVTYLTVNKHKQTTLLDAC